MPLKEKYQQVLDLFVQRYDKEQGEIKFLSWVETKNLQDKINEKPYSFSVKFKSIEGDFVEGNISTTDIDYYKDKVIKECIEDMSLQISSATITMDEEHEAFMGKTELERLVNRNKISRAKIVDHEIKDDGNKLWVRAKLNKDHRHYKELKSSIVNGFVNAFSIAYLPLKISYKQIGEDSVRLLERVKLLNVGMTSIPANENAMITNTNFTEVATKSLSDMYFDDEATKSILEDLAKGDKDSIEVKSMADKSLFDKIKAGDKLSEAELKSLDKLNLVEVKEEKKKEDEEEDPDAEKPVEGEEVKSLKAEIKSLKDANVIELKSIKESLEKLNLKSIEFDKVLSEPVFKARSEQMETLLKSVDKSNVPENKSQGPLDLLI